MTASNSQGTRLPVIHFNSSTYNLGSIFQNELEYCTDQRIDKSMKAERSRTHYGGKWKISRLLFKRQPLNIWELTHGTSCHINSIFNFLEPMFIILRETEWKSDNEMKSVENNYVLCHKISNHRTAYKHILNNHADKTISFCLVMNIMLLWLKE